MESEIEAYKNLEAEYDLLIEISKPLHHIKFKLKQLQDLPRHSKLLAEGILSESAQYLISLEKRIEENEAERRSLAAACLLKEHGIKLGDRIPFAHSKTGESGDIRADDVHIYLMPHWEKNTYVVTGPRYKKSGQLGKRINAAYLDVTIQI